MSTEDLVYNLVGNKEPLKIKRREGELYYVKIRFLEFEYDEL